MPRSSSRKRKTRAKAHRDYGEAGATRKLNPPEPTEKTDKNPPSVGHPKLEVRKIGPAHEPGQTPPRNGPVEPLQEPLIKASDLFTFTKRTLSAEARELLAKLDEGGIPWLITQNLERIAKENGIEVSNKMTPDDIIRRLRNLA
jgi:hypothetical protein